MQGARGAGNPAHAGARLALVDQVSDGQAAQLGRGRRLELRHGRARAALRQVVRILQELRAARTC